MALQYKLDTLDGVDESVQSLYKEVDGGYELDVEGAAPQAKVKEFRDNNIELTNKMKGIEDKLDGLDMDKFNQMFTTVQKMAQSDSDVEMKEALEKGQDAVKDLIEKRAETRAEAMKSDFQTKLEGQTSTASKYREQLEDAKISAELTRLAAEKGVRATAVADVLLRGKQVFKLDDEAKVVAMKGDDVIFNKDNKPLTIGEYMDTLATEAPHLFESSSGGGSDNSVKTTGSQKPGTFTYRGQVTDYSK